MLNQFALLAVSLFCSNLLLGQHDELQKGIDLYFQKEVKLLPKEIIEVGIVYGDSTYVFQYSGDSIQPIEDGVYELGSFSKVFTTHLAGQLALSNQLSFTDSCVKYFPLKRLAHSTIEDLITHKTGLSKYPVDRYDEKEKVGQPYNYTNEYMANYLDESSSSSSSKIYSFSHSNAALLARIIEQVVGVSYEGFVADYFKQFGVDFSNDEEELVESAILGKEPYDVSFFDGSVGLKSNLKSLLNFTNLTINSDKAAFAQTILPLSSTQFEGVEVGMGWHLMHYIKKHPPIITHVGKTNMHQVFVGLIKETNTGVVVLSNNSSGNGQVGLDLLEMINFDWKLYKRLNKKAYSQEVE